MIKQLPSWKFIMIWMVAIVAALGYFIGQVRWW
ncbi:phage protein [Escherichia coli]|nr:phage protein [Escherichia coli]